jgi:hypothetical protein
MSKQSKRAAFAHRIREQRRTGSIIKRHKDNAYFIGVARNISIKPADHSRRYFADIGAVFIAGL